jgi:hypothetical protein
MGRVHPTASVPIWPVLRGPNRYSAGLLPDEPQFLADRCAGEDLEIKSVTGRYHRYKVRIFVATTVLWPLWRGDTDRLLDPNAKGQTVGVSFLSY